MRSRSASLVLMTLCTTLLYRSGSSDRDGRRANGKLLPWPVEQDTTRAERLWALLRKWGSDVVESGAAAAPENTGAHQAPKPFQGSTN